MSERSVVVTAGETINEPRVRTLGYIGGEGGYCEPIIVTFDGDQSYLLHRMFLANRKASKWDEDNWVGVHEKVEYGSQEELEAAFGEVRRRLTSEIPGLEWSESDSSLGFDIPAEEFAGATSRTLAIPWDQRRNGCSS